MPENATRDLEGLYDHERDAPLRRRPADDWGIDESFPRVRGRRFARHDGRASEGPSRSRRRPVEDWGADEAFDPPAALTEAPMPEESIVAEVVDAPAPEQVVSDGRRTIRINGRPGEVSEIAPFTSAARRRRPPLTVEERLAGNPTRIIAWAFLLGLLLILIAVLTS
ncbi:MAG: hypothetical protein ABI611_22545 [Solirubrobacteraceae bacterium]